MFVHFFCKHCYRFVNSIDLFKELASCFIDFSLLFDCFQCYWFLLFIISFLLLALSLFCSFPGFLRWEAGYWRETLLLFHCELSVSRFPIYLLLWLCPQILVCCISLSLSSASFFISLENISLPHGLSRSMLFSFQALVLFHDWFPVDSIVVVEHTLRYLFQICWAYVFHNCLLKHFNDGFFKNHRQIQHLCDLGAGVYWLCLHSVGDHPGLWCDDQLKPGHSGYSVPSVWVSFKPSVWAAPLWRCSGRGRGAPPRYCQAGSSALPPHVPLLTLRGATDEGKGSASPPPTAAWAGVAGAP